MAAPRIALGAFMLESNGHAPPATRAEFEAGCWLEGAALAADLARPAPRAPTPLTGFIRAMDAGRDWTPVPLLAAAAGASGPVEQDVFDDLLLRFEGALRASLPVDGVFLALHGAATATVEVDPDGVLLARVRAIVGPDVPIIATLDLHANVSRTMVDRADLLVAYLTNPHVDMLERGAEAAAAMRAMLGGLRPRKGFLKLPMIPPATSQNTDGGPYADAIAHGRGFLDHEVMNVSISAGFSLGDTPKNGLSVVVTTRTDAARAQTVAEEIARFIWSSRGRWVANLLPLEEATRRARATGADPRAAPLLFADVADNPGGGGRGNTTWILEAFHAAGVQGAVLGVFNDPELAAEAHLLGAGAAFPARFNRAETHPLSHAFAAPAVVEALHDGHITGRRGIYAGRALDLGPMALLRLDGLRVAVATNRRQLCEPAMLEALGVDIARVRTLVVKSRGHFRAGFDEVFTADRILEVDVPGLTTVMLNRVPWRRAPRPIWPLDPAMEWAP
ncbi:M81 family metallopeptidase [Roseomonas sp. JC162]|uniref:Microcystinase C n=1 Tax=Neoroseomonas marina TaxID=1232220 RepID=A0A848EI41_9PROT|nr:M81 family metallopeptidase [Neoroseomonas marina]NMJ43087.1 M81 family metallopeptidase [Neoroseomonas marina]